MKAEYRDHHVVITYTLDECPRDLLILALTGSGPMVAAPVPVAEPPQAPKQAAAPVPKPKPSPEPSLFAAPVREESKAALLTDGEIVAAARAVYEAGGWQPIYARQVKERIGAGPERYGLEGDRGVGRAIAARLVRCGWRAVDLICPGNQIGTVMVYVPADYEG